jgi:hypothetical protein
MFMWEVPTASTLGMNPAFSFPAFVLPCLGRWPQDGSGVAQFHQMKKNSELEQVSIPNPLKKNSMAVTAACRRS